MSLCNDESHDAMAEGRAMRGFVAFIPRGILSKSDVCAYTNYILLEMNDVHCEAAHSCNLSSAGRQGQAGIICVHVYIYIYIYIYTHIYIYAFKVLPHDDKAPLVT